VLPTILQDVSTHSDARALLPEEPTEADCGRAFARGTEYSPCPAAPASCMDAAGKFRQGRHDVIPAKSAAVIDALRRCAGCGMRERAEPVVDES